MKKITKKGPSKASKKRTTKNLDVKPAKGATVRGGVHGGWDQIANKKI